MINVLGIEQNDLILNMTPKAEVKLSRIGKNQYIINGTNNSLRF